MDRIHAAEISNGEETPIVLDLSTRFNPSDDTIMENWTPPDANLQNEAENVELKNETPIVKETQPKSRKKPRKQNLNSSNVRPSANMQFEDDDNMENAEDTFVNTIRKQNRESEENAEAEAPNAPTSSYIRNQPHMYMLKR